jgi:hypothetical protein
MVEHTWSIEQWKMKGNVRDIGTGKVILRRYNKGICAGIGQGNAGWVRTVLLRCSVFYFVTIGCGRETGDYKINNN